MSFDFEEASDGSCWITEVQNNAERQIVKSTQEITAYVESIVDELACQGKRPSQLSREMSRIQSRSRPGIGSECLPESLCQSAGKGIATKVNFSGTTGILQEEWRGSWLSTMAKMAEPASQVRLKREFARDRLACRCISLRRLGTMTKPFLRFGRFLMSGPVAFGLAISSSFPSGTGSYSYRGSFNIVVQNLAYDKLVSVWARVGASWGDIPASYMASLPGGLEFWEAPAKNSESNFVATYRARPE